MGGSRQIISFTGRLPASALECDRTLRGELPFLKCVCVEESTKELVGLFVFRSGGLAIFSEATQLCQPCPRPYLNVLIRPSNRR